MGGIRDRSGLFGSGKTHGKRQIIAIGIIGIVDEQGQAIIMHVISSSEHLVIVPELREVLAFDAYQAQRAGDSRI